MSSNLEAVTALGEAIRSQRKRLGLSQQEVADLAGVSLNLLSQVESGKPAAQLSKILDIITALGLQFELQPGQGRIAIQVNK